MNDTWRPPEYVDFPPAVRRVFAVAVLLALMVLFSLPWAPEKPRGTIATTSPFLQERYHAKATDDRAILRRIAGALEATGHKDDAELADQVWRRAVLKRLLGEPYALTGDIESALRAEAAAPESIEALARRVVARVLVWRRGEDGEATIGRDSGDAYYTIRMTLSNGLAAPVTGVGLYIPPLSAQFPNPPLFGCKPEDRTPDERERQAAAEARLKTAQAKGGPFANRYSKTSWREVLEADRELRYEIAMQKGVPIAPGATSRVVCGGHARGWEAGAVDVALRKGGMPQPFQLRSAVAGGYEVTPPYVTQRSEIDDYAEGRKAALAADCRALATCEAQRLAWMEELRLRIPQLAFAAMVVVIAALMGYGVSRTTARIEPPDNGFVTLLSGFALASVVLLLLELYWVLNPHVGLLALFFGNVVIQTAMAGVGAALVLGVVMAWDREHATRLRLFTLGMVLIGALGGYVVAFRCGVSPYTLSFACG
jgi:hypothetical protein